MLSVSLSSLLKFEALIVGVGIIVAFLGFVRVVFTLCLEFAQLQVDASWKVLGISTCLITRSLFLIESCRRLVLMVIQTSFSVLF